jgi:BirA family biotin operon repressor/biotin-[acetyl-CoA-carboxylase] ligase
MNGAIQAKRRALAAVEGPHPWRLRSLAVGASTETELGRWLERQAPAEQLTVPRLVVARRQCFGHGQQGRRWESPAGGVWLSAALPWPAEPQVAAAPGLAVALALAEALIARGAPVQLKWPNDLLLLTPTGPRKLAGLLPGLRLRGSRIRWARIGLGLNGRNPVPAGAANLRQQPGLWHGEPLALTALVLRALERAMALAGEAEAVRTGAEALLAPTDPQWLEGSWWQPQGLAPDGGLRLVRGDGRERILRRF